VGGVAKVMHSDVAKTSFADFASDGLIINTLSQTKQSKTSTRNGRNGLEDFSGHDFVLGKHGRYQRKKELALRRCT